MHSQLMTMFVGCCRAALVVCCCCCCWAEIGALPVSHRNEADVEASSIVSPLSEGDMNGFLLKRLVEICTASGGGGGEDARCGAQRLEAEARRIGFSAEHGRALHRLVGFCADRLGDCVSLASGLTRELLAGEAASGACLRLIISLSETSPQAVADTKALLTAERTPVATASAAAGSAADGSTTSGGPAVALDLGGALRRRRSLAGHSEAADLPTTPGDAVGGGGHRAKRNVSPFMYGMYVQFSKQQCGSQPCPTGRTPTQHSRMRVVGH